MFSTDTDGGNLKILTIGFFIYFIGWGIVLPYMPLYFKTIAKTYSLVGILFGIQFLLQSLVSIPIGSLVDKIGRKSILVFSWLQYTLLGGLYANAYNIVLIGIARIYNSLSATGLWISGRSTARYLSPKGKEAESMGLFNTGYLSGRVIGAVIASVLVLYLSLNHLFYSLSVFGLLAALIAYKKLPETLKERKELKQGVEEIIAKDHIFMKEMREFFSNLKQAKIAFAYLLVGFLFTMMLMILSLFVDFLKGELWQIGIVYALLYLPFCLQFELGKFGDRIGRKNLILFGSLLSFGCFLILSLTSSLLLTFILALFLGIGITSIMPNLEAYITDLSHGHEGETTGIYRAIRSLGSGLGPITAGFISDIYSLSLVFLLAGVIVLLVPFMAFWYDG